MLANEVMYQEFASLVVTAMLIEEPDLEELIRLQLRFVELESFIQSQERLVYSYLKSLSEEIPYYIVEPPYVSGKTVEAYNSRIDYYECVDIIKRYIGLRELQKSRNIIMLSILRKASRQVKTIVTWLEIEALVRNSHNPNEVFKIYNNGKVTYRYEEVELHKSLKGLPFLYFPIQSGGSSYALVGMDSLRVIRNMMLVYVSQKN